MTRHRATVLSLSWIPSEGIRGLGRLAFDHGFTHYDEPPPDVIDDLIALRDNDRFRFANELSAFVEIDDGQIVGHGYAGGGLIGTTTLSLAGAHLVFQAYQLPIIQHPAEVGDHRPLLLVGLAQRGAVGARRAPLLTGRLLAPVGLLVRLLGGLLVAAGRRRAVVRLLVGVVAARCLAHH